MRILVLGPQDVFPTNDGGTESTYGALSALARNHDIYFAFPRSPLTPASDGLYEAIGVKPLPLAFTPLDTLGGILLSSVRLRPFKFEKYCTRAAMLELADAIKGIEFDALICITAHTAGLGLSVRRHLGAEWPVILREHNIEYQLASSYADARGPVERWLALRYSYLVKRREQQLWRLCDAVAFITDRELSDAISSKALGNFIYLPEGTRPPVVRNDAPHAARDGVLILFNPRALQNVINLRTFILTYWSQIRPAGRPPLRVTGVTNDELQALVGLNGAELDALNVTGIGFQSDLAAQFEQSVALIAPTFIGGGIRKKILESMSNGLPVVASHLDVRSSSFFVDGENILGFGDVDTLAAAMQKMSSPATWGDIAANGRETVAKHASWDAFVDVLVPEIRRLSTRGNHG